MPRERILHVAQSLFHDHVPGQAARPDDGLGRPPSRTRGVRRDAAGDGRARSHRARHAARSPSWPPGPRSSHEPRRPAARPGDPGATASSPTRWSATAGSTSSSTTPRSTTRAGDADQVNIAASTRSTSTIASAGMPARLAARGSHRVRTPRVGRRIGTRTGDALPYHGGPAMSREASPDGQSRCISGESSRRSTPQRPARLDILRYPLGTRARTAFRARTRTLERPPWLPCSCARPRHHTGSRRAHE